METFSILLVLVGILLFFVGIIWFIVDLIRRQSLRDSLASAFVGVGAVLFIGGLIITGIADRPATPTSTLREPTLIDYGFTNKTIAYKELFRNNKQYEGQYFYFRGEIVQVRERARHKYDFRVNISDDWTENEVVYLSDYAGQRLLEDDTIEFVGQSIGLYRYESIFGATITIPELRAVDVKLVSE